VQTSRRAARTSLLATTVPANHPAPTVGSSYIRASVESSDLADARFIYSAFSLSLQNYRRLATSFLFFSFVLKDSSAIIKSVWPPRNDIAAQEKPRQCKNWGLLPF
jgi:hypothetical protein